MEPHHNTQKSGQLAKVGKGKGKQEKVFKRTKKI